MLITKIERDLPTPPRRINVAAYARVSADKDAMLRSLSAQVSHYSEMIQSNPEWEYAGVFADYAASGTKDSRAEFKRMLEECGAGNIDLVVTKSVSRFARNTLDLLRAVRELRELGVDVYFEEQNIHTMSADGELMLTLLAGFAQEESLSVSENCKWRIRKRFENGETANLRFMFGYDINKDGVFINEGQAAVVRLIFADYIGGVPTSHIARRLNERGIAACRGGKWNTGQVTELIKNEKYTGDSLLQKTYISDHLTKRKKRNLGELPKYYAEGTHPAIIGKDTFEAAQKLMAGRTFTTGIPKKTYPFTGKIVCGKCGKHYKRKKGAGRFYWQCSAFLRDGKSCCGAKQIPEAVLKRLTDGLDFTRIDVTGDRSVGIALSDGSVVGREWQYASRARSWTPEMRETARRRELERREKPNG